MKGHAEKTGIDKVIEFKAASKSAEETSKMIKKAMIYKSVKDGFK
tara:strand:- start:78 stop:212 length:135 start_codon:yes stop_codon:yes gene_type:complete